jgi:hypothetical protein
MMAKEVFDMLAEYKWDKEHFSVKVAKEDITSQDGKVLSQKQVTCLYNYFNLNIKDTLYYIKNSNYKEISDKIGEILKELKGKSE